jgi:hypothetical protein
VEGGSVDGWMGRWVDGWMGRWVDALHPQIHRSTDPQIAHN